MIFLLVALGCASGAPDENPDADMPDDVTAEPAPPWEGPALSRSEAPSVLISEWEKAENRSSCAPLTFRSFGITGSRTPRRANFGGGWAVAWDLPNGPGTAASGDTCADCGRGAFGIAGTGVEPTPDTYDDWPYQVTWSDGSRVGYGPRNEQWLAYLEVAGERCLYNVWSYRSREHLEELIDQIRRVRP